MATLAQLEEGLVKAYKAGNMDAARKLAVVIAEARKDKSLAIPGAESAEIPGTTPPKPDRSIGETLQGTGEAALTMLTGAVAAPIAAVGGLASGAIQTMRGQPSDARAKAGQIADALTYSPGEAGQEQLQAVGEALAPLRLEALGPMAQVARVGAAAPQMTQAARAAAGQAAPGAMQRVQQVTQKLMPTASVPDAAAAGDIAAAQRAGVDLMTSDVRPPSTFIGKTAQQTAERIPGVGTGGMRESQQVQRVEAVKDVLRDYGAADSASASDAVMADLAATRGKELSKYTTMKREVMTTLDDRGPVDVTNTVDAIDKQIAAQQAIGTQQAQKVAAVLEDFKQAAQGKPLSVLDEVRKQVGKAFDGENMADIKDAGTKALQAVYGPLRRDMDSHIESFGDRRDLAKWKVANTRLSQMAGELDNRTLRSVLRYGDAQPEVVARMLFSKKPSDVRALYGNLSEQGKSHARAAILAKAAEDAGGIDDISPDRFANAVKRLGSSVGVAFSGDDLARVNGLVRVLKLTKRAGEFSASPPTGVQLAVPLGFGFMVDALGGMGAATVGALTIGGAARLYESPMVRNMLIGISKTKPGSPQEAAMAVQISEKMRENARETQRKTGKF